MKKYILLILSIIYVTCNSQNDNNEFFVEERLLRNIKIEENSNIIYSDISKISLSPDGTKLLLIDAFSGMGALHDARFGNILQVFNPGIDLSDSIAKYNIQIREDSEYVLNSEIKNQNGEPYTTEELEQWINNRFQDADFINDSMILFTAYIEPNCFRYNGNKKIWGLGIETAFILYNINNFSMSVKQVNKKLINKKKMSAICPQATSFIYDSIHKNVLIKCTNNSAWKNKIYDSLPILAVYNLSGKFISTILNLPEEYTESKLGYRYSNPVLILNDSNDIITTFSFTNKIYNISRKSYFTLNGFDNLDFSRLNDTKHPDFPIKINRIYQLKNSKYMVYLLILDNVEGMIKVKEHLLHEYSEDGIFIRKINIPTKNKFGSIRNVHYSCNENSVMIFRKSDEKGWFLSYWDMD